MTKQTSEKGAAAKSEGRQFTGVSMRTAGDVDGRIDRIIDALAKRSAGIAPKRNTVARQALIRGLDALERELGI